jgi:hypothetical protein
LNRPVQQLGARPAPAAPPDPSPRPAPGKSGVLAHIGAFVGEIVRCGISVALSVMVGLFVYYWLMAERTGVGFDLVLMLDQRIPGAGEIAATGMAPKITATPPMLDLARSFLAATLTLYALSWVLRARR